MNQAQSASCFRSWTDADADYLRDESRRTGHADAIAFPADAAGVHRAVAEARDHGMLLTLQGARTGITGGAVPDGGAVLNLSRMDRILALREGAGGAPSLIVEPGLTLQELNRRLAARTLGIDEPDTATRERLEPFSQGPGWFFAPDPTETSATLGGMVSCNASGACSFRYGATRRHIRGLTVMLPDARTLALQRGRERGQGHTFRLTTREGGVLEGSLPCYRAPAVKNAAGYHVADDMDLVDLWIGAEGTLGVVTAIELQLMPAPAVCWGLTAFFSGDAAALRFVRAVRGEERERPAGAASISAIEFFDERVLRLIEAGRAANESLQHELPALPAQAGAAVYVELHADGEPAALETLEFLADAITECGGDDASTWIADSAAELQRLHQFRHAAPELVNLRIDQYRRQAPALTKLGTDMAVPAAHLENVLAMFRQGLADRGLDYVVFGHIGDNHFHVNILPATMAEFAAGKQLYQHWARQVIDWGGTVSAEHGIGKLKTGLLRDMLGDEGIDALRAIRAQFDPGHRFNRGNLFE